MVRIGFYLLGVGVAFAASVVWRSRVRASRPIPVQQAAALLQQAWADHRTRA